MIYPLKRIVAACSGLRDVQLKRHGYGPAVIRKYFYETILPFSTISYLEDWYPDLQLDYEVPPSISFRPDNFPIDLYRQKIRQETVAASTIILLSETKYILPKSRYEMIRIPDSSTGRNAIPLGKWHVEYFENDMIPIKQRYAIITPRLMVKTITIKSQISRCGKLNTGPILDGFGKRIPDSSTGRNSIHLGKLNTGPILDGFGKQIIIEDPYPSKVQVSLSTLLQDFPILIVDLGNKYGYDRLWSSL